MIVKKEKLYIPGWLQGSGILLVILMVLAAGDQFLAYLIGGMIALGCASKCYDWGKRLGNKGILAYLIGFFFSLIGLLLYYIYYLIRKK